MAVVTGREMAVANSEFDRVFRRDDSGAAGGWVAMV
jgi:hypothetical protein